MRTGVDYDIDIKNMELESMYEHMYFNEELNDLYVGEFIDKHRYRQLRVLFQSKERAFAIRVVKELHSENII